ncbi:ATP-binding protein [Flavobacterium sp.]|uniref:tetratricopeptide repeat-containing sensor histidine kinase n=1 Tax=Flavobacterium sp. TaxID=239 RepID=UPI0026059A9B|nr:ATP-binding protein [Flavobacterium sp.]
MIKRILVLLFIVLFSCQKEDTNRQESKAFTKNQKQIIEWFRIAKSLRNKKHFLIKNYADSIQSLIKNESNDFKATAKIAYGIYYNSINNDSLSFKNFNASFNLLKDSKVDSLKISTFAGLGNYYKHTGQYEKSLKNLLNALKLSEKLKDSLMIGGIYANLGQLYLQKEEMKLAKQHLILAINYLENYKLNPHYLIAIHTMANLQGMNGNLKEALKIDEEGLKICEKIKSDNLKATFLDNKANCFMFSNQLDSAKYYFNECLKLDLLSKNEKQISDSYANLAQLAIFCNNDAEVLNFANKSIKIAKNVNYNPGIAKSYNLLVDFYKNKGNYKSALEYSNKYQSVYKSLINERKEVAAAEFKTIYETEKKEKELLISKTKIAESELQIKKKNTQFEILSLISLALITIGYLIYRQQKLKNKQQEQEFQLKSAIKEIENQNQLHEQRLSISRDLHDNIGAQLTFVISSVDNLKFGNKITDTKINNQLTKISDFTKATIIELRDTIWAMNKDEFSFEDLRSRIFNFIEKAKIAKEDIDFEFKIDEQLSEIKLSSFIGINIYRTIQEAINNSIKYSNGNKIYVDVKKMNNKIQIEIQDNGKGFDIENIDFGNGLRNMKKRIEEIDGEFEVNSIVEKGTRITILFN